MQQALALGHEGVVVKSVEAPYDAGRRGSAWVKVKPVHTLDLVVLAVEWGSGRREGWLSNIHLGRPRPDDGDGFVMLGKTFKGMTDEMLAWQTERFTELAVDPDTIKDHYVVPVRPEQVVEIAFDGIQRSSRYPGGVALRFARVVRYRDDKSPAEADTLAIGRGRCSDRADRTQPARQGAGHVGRGRHRRDLGGHAARGLREGRLLEQAAGRRGDGLGVASSPTRRRPAPAASHAAGVAELVGRRLGQAQLRYARRERLEHHSGAGLGDHGPAASQEERVRRVVGHDDAGDGGVERARDDHQDAECGDGLGGPAQVLGVGVDGAEGDVDDRAVAGVGERPRDVVRQDVAREALEGRRPQRERSRAAWGCRPGAATAGTGPPTSWERAPTPGRTPPRRARAGSRARSRASPHARPAPRRPRARRTRPPRGRRGRARTPRAIASRSG